MSPGMVLRATVGLGVDRFSSGTARRPFAVEGTSGSLKVSGGLCIFSLTSKDEPSLPTSLKGMVWGLDIRARTKFEACLYALPLAQLER